MTAARIPVADDEPSLRWLLERVLRQAGHSVTVVEDGASALARAAPNLHGLARAAALQLYATSTEARRPRDPRAGSTRAPPA